MPRRIRAVDGVLAAWTASWLVAAALTYSSLEQLEEGGSAVVSAGQGLEETSKGLDRAARGLRETADALAVVGDLPFVPGNPGSGLGQTATDVEDFATRVRVTGADARATGADARSSASTLAVVLGLAVALGPTLPILFLYVLLRPLVVTQLKGA